jgi:Fe-S cluster assembly protein SufD
MSDVAAAADLYCSEFAAFERKVAGITPAWLRRLRRAAIARFTELGFPTTHNEAWRQTGVASLMDMPFQLAHQQRDIPRADLEPLMSWLGPSHHLVLVNGRFSSHHSSLLPLPPGVKVESLASALADDASLLEPRLGQYARYADHPFVALNTAFLSDGALVYLPPNTVVEEPILLLFVSNPNGRATMSHPRTLIVADANSRATIVESYVGLHDAPSFTNAVIEVVLAEGSAIEHSVFQQESTTAVHLSTVAVHQARHSTFTSHSLATGGALARSEITSELADVESTCTLRGIYAIAGRQHLSTQTTIDHAKPHGTSRQLYKGILDGQATGVFTGRIRVRQDAQKTDARQTNNNLLLSEDAVAHTAPQLEILADDVTCAHGATVGQLDQGALFYLRSRGIGLEAARSLMAYAFGSEALNLITHDPIRDRFAGQLAQWISRARRRSVSE